ncbi:MAG: hypothetical protein JJU11_17640 [Candidatus Sumerlaeia bacterium]|nr:hypothetical protein [Candidatus Sumerlaeia bacterium]
MKQYMRILLTITLGLTFFASMACQRTGPSSVTMGRGKFNDAIQQTNAEQLLTNIVRLRYRDTPHFMQVASVSVGMEVQIGASGSGTFPEATMNTFGLGLSGSYKEKPTVTYTPLQGEQFVTQLLSPIDERTIVLLVNTGWSISRVARISLQDLNGLENARTATGPTPDHEPRYREFKEVFLLLREIEKRGGLQLGYAQTGEGDPALNLTFAQAEADSSELARIRELLGLNPGRLVYSLGINRSGADITATSRSLMGAFYYLSQGTRVPARDERRGSVSVTMANDGGEFDWMDMLGGLMEIRTAHRRPSSAHLAVPYRGVWFYLDDADLDSKSTFVLLQQLFALQSVNVRGMMPILTIPVSN